MTKRLALLALLAGVLAAIPGPDDHAQAAFPGKNGGSRSCAPPAPVPWRRSSWSARPRA